MLYSVLSDNNITKNTKKNLQLYLYERPKKELKGTKNKLKGTEMDFWRIASEKFRRDRASNDKIRHTSCICFYTFVISEFSNLVHPNFKYNKKTLINRKKLQSLYA